MALGKPELDFLLHEHLYRPIGGRVVAIGRQTILLDAKGVLAMLAQRGITSRLRPDQFEIDKTGQHNNTGKPVVTDLSAFAAFTDCSLESVDISAYEGAEHVFDICGEVPRDLIGQFDFVLDGGSLDNVFDAFRMISNMALMLKPGGRMFCYVWGNSHPTAYLKVSPDWLMDFCAINDFADCKVYSLVMPPRNPSLLARWRKQYRTMWQYDPHVEINGQIGYECSGMTVDNPAMTLMIAEKGTGSTHDRPAIQKHYRGSAAGPYKASVARFRSTPRPVYSSPGSLPLSDVPPISPYTTMKPVARWRA